MRIGKITKGKVTKWQNGKRIIISEIWTLNQRSKSEYTIIKFPDVSSMSTQLTLPTLGFFENGSLGEGSKWPPSLKIFNNEVKMLKLVPNLGNRTNFSKLHTKKFCDKIFWWRQHFLAKSGKFRRNFQKIVIF